MTDMNINNSTKYIESYKLLSFIPLWTILTEGETVKYKFFGIPVWKVRTILDEQNETCRIRYYLLGLFIFETQINSKDCSNDKIDYEDIA